MANCIYCGERAGIWARNCKDCRKLEEKVGTYGGQVGFSELLDHMEETGVRPEIKKNKRVTILGKTQWIRLKAKNKSNRETK